MMKKISTLILAAVFAFSLTITSFARQSANDNRPTLQTTDEVKLPETPAGKTFAAFLKAFNSGDIETLRKFHQERKGNPANAEKDMEAYNQTGAMKIVRINQSSDYALDLLVETKNSGMRLNFAIEVDHNAPHGIVSIHAQPAQ